MNARRAPRIRASINHAPPYDAVTNGAQQEALQPAKATLVDRRLAARVDVVEGREVLADRVVSVCSLHDQGPTRLMRASRAKTVTGIRAGMRGCNARRPRIAVTRRRRVNHAEREQGVSGVQCGLSLISRDPNRFERESDRRSREKYELPLTRAGTVRALARTRVSTRAASRPERRGT